MNPELKRITDRNIIYQYLKNVFNSRPVFLKTKEFNVEVKSFTFSEKGIFFSTDEDLSEAQVNLYVRNKTEVVFARVRITENTDAGYRCEASDILLMELPRKEERYSSGSDSGDAKVVISNILSEFTLRENFEDNKRSIVAMKDDFEEKLSKKYNRAEVYVISEQKPDVRMSYFINERKPYFIKDITDASGKDDEMYKYYIETIYPADKEKDRRLISEIAVPFLYKYLLPFGYLKISSARPLSGEDYSFAKKNGMNISTYFSNDTKIIKSSPDRIAICDLSMTGLGVSFKERALIKYFREKSLILFTVYLPGNKTSTVMCRVENINIMKNSMYKIGCSILNFDAIGEVNYSEYLDALSS